MTKTFSCLSICFLLSLSAALGQQSQSIFVYKGVVISAKTGKPVSYATISLDNSSLNTMTNENGEFRFKVPAENKKRTLTITHVGYKPLAKLITEDSLYTIAIEEQVMELKEVTVKKINALELLKNAMEKVPENYSNSPFRAGGFYRMTGRKEKKIIDLSEAVYNIYYENYSKKNSQFNLVKSRVDKDLTAFNGADNVSMGLDPSAVTDLDMLGDIKGSELLGEKGLAQHDFVFKGIVDYNGHNVYELSFDQKEGIKKPLYKGKIFIDTDDLAFLEFDISLSPRGMAYYDWGFFMKMMLNMAHVKARVLSDSKIITYRKFGRKYYLNRANSESRIYLAGGNRHFVFDPLVTKINFLVTSIDTQDVKPFQKDEILRNKASIESRSHVMRDSRDGPDHSDTTDRFWENYNLILAEFNVDSAIRIIQANNTTLNYKEQLAKYLRKNGKDKVKAIDSVISFYHGKDQFNGAALIQSDGKLIYEKGFGMADKEKSIPNSGETQFRIGSTSKSFTAMLIMQLASENKISVSDTIGKWLPGYVHGNITIRQLLTHQSGIPNYTDNPEYLLKILNRKYTPEELVKNFCSDSLEFPPGSQFSYCNSGYVILADVIEKITGKKYAGVLSEMIFVPLGMKNSYFVFSAGKDNRAKGYINGEPENPYPVDNVVGAGGITSTAEDLLIWANALTSGKLLPQEKMQELFLPRVEWKEWDASYGYGWMIDRNLFQVSSKHTINYHPGTEFGFFDMLVLQPDKGIVVVLLSNTGDFPRFDITDLILSELN